MDQESFRRILETQGAGSSSAATSRGSLLSASKPKKRKDVSAKPAFKPRKLKALAVAEDSKYRDRALERRHGEGNDFAHVEALLEDFEEQNKYAQDLTKLEEKRKYLGGDSEHSVLVKGLDFALLEQNKARAAFVNDALDDDSLEKAFQDVSATDKPKKSRKDLLQELKDMRAAGGQAVTDMVKESASAEEDARRLEEAKQQGKFKPIGFKPIGQSASESKKKKKGKVDGDDGERKKKKRKLEPTARGAPAKPTSIDTQRVPELPAQTPNPESEPVDEDFDIFADAGDYDGLELGDDYDEEESTEKHQRSPPEESEGTAPRQWIAVDDSGRILSHKHSEPLSLVPSRVEPSSLATDPPGTHSGEDAEIEDATPMKLVPLVSSALPDIKGLLQMDRAAGSSYKNKKRKDKKKGESTADSKPSAEERAERDYKKLKAYTDKKAVK